MLQTLKNQLRNRRAESGFTLVELLIVIVVIAILAAIVINTFAGVQAKARDTERQTDMKAVASQLEVYYTNNGGYPSEAVMAGTPVASLQGLSPDAIVNPQAPSTETNSIIIGAAAADVKKYKYAALPASCADKACIDFTITYITEKPQKNNSTTQVVDGLAN